MLISKSRSDKRSLAVSNFSLRSLSSDSKAWTCFVKAAKFLLEEGVETAEQLESESLLVLAEGEKVQLDSRDFSKLEQKKILDYIVLLVCLLE